ncbi:SMI1/KNR4 family protein [Bacillus pseudomycoides]|uniref:SMI1/KNR4 family protein n=1 Tax=Bacillus pseudomycoides TaxID=64104 RepID=A0AA91VE80_9BACI|nr:MULTISPECIES: SMI1/KNR4 family protein [Bacillus]PEB56958.1 SMI1/KNR4 family protein [Bacillus sp. AFS098217]PED83422.1 SMI1/KNR4 family protein [Bacillus pseudomycoides]PEU15322.1 SMI1/KNR4 family protein [Bacillus sp. AFS019443]PEU17305.1 SMI1/KNR4 family protein [Bacillus sp. AFS014408]PFW61066.1 SMI1/KNR4 family protein [Bacillus sp. AFS075034]
MKQQFNSFWDDSDEFVNPIRVTDEMIAKVEQTLSYKLPESYITLIKTQNGGTPLRTCFSTTVPTSWADNHIAIVGIYGIGGEHGIDTESPYLIEEFDYPRVGIIVCESPTAGHDAVMLDYSKCGNQGEPIVIHVNVENYEDPIITFLAKDFQTFINGLVDDSDFD